MNKQRKVVITTTYNEMGIIIDTKAQEVAQPDLQPTCNQLATDCISRRAAIDEMKSRRDAAKEWYDEADDDKIRERADSTIASFIECILTLKKLPSAEPEIIHCKDCKYGEQDEIGRWYCRGLGCQIGDDDGNQGRQTSLIF